MGPSYAVVEVHVLGATPGQWCGRCFLPSVTEWDVAWVNPDTLRIVNRYRVASCDEECEPPVFLPIDHEP